MKTRCLPRLVLLILLASAVQATEPSAPSAPPPASPPASRPLTHEEASRLTRDLMPRVEQLRGLGFKRPVPVKVVDDAEARRHFKARLDRFYPERTLRAEQQVFMDLGLIPAGSDLVSEIFSLLEEQAAGYYDPDTDTFHVLDDMPRSVGAVLIVHELTHALDDQHHAIDRLFEQASDDSDRATMVSAVVEGSGSLVMSAFMLAEVQEGRMSLDAVRELMQSEAGRAERLTSAPAVLQRALLAPYLLGQTLALRGNPAALASGVKPHDIDRLFTQPPVSTEQLLHPEKYWEAGREDLPRAVPLADLSATLGEGWSLDAEGNLGELTLALLCGASNPPLDAASATLPAAWTNDCAAGWGGDRWQLYRNGPRHVSLVAVTWDTEADAVVFASELTAAGRRTGRDGAAVVLIGGSAGAPAALGEAALRALSAPTPAP